MRIARQLSKHVYCRRDTTLSTPLTRSASSATGQSWHSAIELKNPSVNAIVSISTSQLMEETRNGTLKDINIAIKDNICTKTMPTTCSSAMLKDFTSPFDATVVDLLQTSGAAIIGKTNCDEFGMGSLNIHSAHGVVFNPYQSPTALSTPWEDRERRSAGGSSGGSAAAVAAGMCDAALATDTGGSTRLPASYCGVVGLKPSYGLISRWGVVSFADSLDCVGIMARNVGTVRRVFETTAVYDPKDPTAALPETRQKAQVASTSSQPSFSKFESGRSLEGLRIGIPQEYFPSELHPQTIAPLRRLLTRLSDAGASLIPVSLPSTAYGLSAYYVLASAEVGSCLGRFDGVRFGMHVPTPPGGDKTKTSNIYAHTRSAGFGAEVKKRILLGTYALTADAFDNYFLQAQRVRLRVREDFNNVFRVPNVLSNPPSIASVTNQATHPSVDVLIHPSAIRTAPLLTSSQSQESSLESYVQDVLTVPASLAGLPALSVPCGMGEEDGWPVGASVVGQWGCDEFVLRVGEILEQI